MYDKLSTKLFNYNGVEIEINNSIFSNEFILTLCDTMRKHSNEKYINNIFIRIVFDDNDFEFYHIDTTIIYTDNTIKTFECGFSSGGYFFGCFECDRKIIYQLIENIR